jgi:hypothetical protein
MKEKSMSKKTGIVLFMMALAVLVSCGKNAGKTQAGAAGEDARDLGGMEIIIGNWWADWDVDTYQANSADAERTLAWRKEIQQKYNFKMKEKQITGWGEMQEIVSTSIMAGDPAAPIFILQPNWAMALYRQGLLSPVSDIPGIDFTETKPVEWNADTKNAFTFDNKVYAFAVGTGVSQHGNGVFFNKRQFQESGLDPNLPYDMQKSGQWTWNTFLDICKKLTRDINNDGIIDVYALATLADDTLDTIVASNNAHYVDKDASGRFVNATGRPEFLQALQFSMRLYTEGYLMPQPEGSAWNWYEPVFHDGRAAMRVAPQYVAQNLADMTDDWGYVMFPRGPNASTYITSNDENVYVIPSTYSAEDIEKILFAFKLWSTPAPGNDAPDAWKESLYNIYRDSRAIDETLQMMREPSHNIYKYFLLIPGLQRGDMSWNMWFDGVDPASLIESVQQSWDALISEVNNVN